MCGIAGTYQQFDGESTARVMGRTLAHRGPDDEGLYSFVTETVNTHLAHRRLSIIDLAHGHQPFLKHHLALSYNGELYNFRELKSELSARGATFQTSSDTEVVLEAWRQWGPGCLRKFRGMFAFAMFDEVSGSLFLARDHLGIKPLHFIRRDGGVVFASELKALVAAFGHELEIEPSALIASIMYYWVPDRRCTLSGVEKLQPGTWAEFRPDGTHQTKTYFDIAEVAAAAAAGPPIDLREVIESSVAAHLVADVPISSFLSGGLDSGIVTVLAKRTNPDVDAYTITFRPEDHRLEAMPDDVIYARKIARQYGIKLHEMQIAPDVVELLPRLVNILDEPIGDPAAINTLLMCEAARDAGVKVILSGMGADELFGGYRKALGVCDGRTLPSATRVGAPSCVDSGHAPPRGCGRTGLPLRQVGQAVPDICRAARGSCFPSQLQPLRPARVSSTDKPRVRTGRRRHIGRTPRDLFRQLPARPRQPDVLGRLEDVPTGAQPHVHRQGQHGGLHRGPCAFRGPGRLQGRLFACRRSQGFRT